MVIIIGNMGGMKELAWLGESKFDKLRRISLIKPIADDLGMKDGDFIAFFMDEDGDIILRKKPEDSHIADTADASLSPEHQKIIDDAVMKLLNEFYRDPEGAIYSELVANKIIESFPKENRMYLASKFREIVSRVGEKMISISER